MATKNGGRKKVVPNLFVRLYKIFWCFSQANEEDLLCRIQINATKGLGDNGGGSLIEAHQRNGKPMAVGEIFSVQLDADKKFKDTAKMVELAREPSHDGLAKYREAMAAKSSDRWAVVNSWLSALLQLVTCTL